MSAEIEIERSVVQTERMFNGEVPTVEEVNRIVHDLRQDHEASLAKLAESQVAVEEKFRQGLISEEEKDRLDHLISSTKHSATVTYHKGVLEGDITKSEIEEGTGAHYKGTSSDNNNDNDSNNNH